MTGIPELKLDGLHPEHADILQAALGEARELLEQAKQGPWGLPSSETRVVRAGESKESE
ncbi:hypothetical protein [Mycobacteroides abscessus]|uniref:hypothetical protein n=1 Tax=Mycobacteroides abscessus TaxID=36809 RepID=UPI00092B19EB|nr:hypothetical protein [Mycobacteroides abscessus]SIA10808.1 Uncharacterised protein [Mycobacteroides abscessus subsp. abscessus]